jgi:uncharacterized membrane protein YgcG
MKIKLSFLFLILILAAPLWAQNFNACDQTVAGLSIGDTSTIKAAAQSVINQGADVRVRDVGTSSNLDFTEKTYESTCLSWQSPNGGRKSTLIVLMVASQSRKLGIYYGSAWHNALDDHWNRIKTDYMMPRFRDRDYAGGFTAALSQIGARLAASKDESLHPKTYTTVNEASDWSWLKWLFIIGGLCFVGFIVWGFVISRREKKEKAFGMREIATKKRGMAANLLAKLQDDLLIAEATGIDDRPARATSNSVSELFNRLSTSENTNPETKDLSYEAYEYIANQYDDANHQLEQARRSLWLLSQGKDSPAGTQQTTSSPFTEPKTVPAPEQTRVVIHKARKKDEKHNISVPPPTPSTSINNTNIFINEETYSPSPAPAEPSKRYDDNSGSRSSGWGGGGSSSSDDSGSDGGGSSDFGSSSDSGGGGDSSFGGGDSGGGGGNDF